jgi:hypothetical protein
VVPRHPGAAEIFDLDARERVHSLSAMWCRSSMSTSSPAATTTRPGRRQMQELSTGKFHDALPE